MDEWVDEMITVLEMALQSTIVWMTYTTEINFLKVFEVRTPINCQQVWYLLRPLHSLQIAKLFL